MIWLWLLRNWRVTVGIGVATVLVLGVWHYGQKQYERGKQQGKVEQVDQDTAIYKQEVAQRDSLLAASQANAAVAEAQIKQLSKHLANLSGQLSDTNQRAATASVQVAAVSDDALFTDIRTKLGQQPSASLAPFTPGELRNIDERITAYDFHVEQINLMLKVTEDLKAQVGALEQLRDELVKQRDAQGAFALQVQQHYVTCFNALPHKRNWLATIFTFGIKGKRKHLDLPLPATLKP